MSLEFTSIKTSCKLIHFEKGYCAEQVKLKSQSNQKPIDMNMNTHSSIVHYKMFHFKCWHLLKWNGIDVGIPIWPSSCVIFREECFDFNLDIVAGIVKLVGNRKASQRYQRPFNQTKMQIRRCLNGITFSIDAKCNAFCITRHFDHPKIDLFTCMWDGNRTNYWYER